MFSVKYIKTFALVILSACILTTSTVYTEKALASQENNNLQIEEIQATIQNGINPISIVNTPKKFLNQNVVMIAKFDKFSTLGLDYKPAFRSSDDYISFLIKRNDTKHDIPLSEMKLFLKRDVAEKFIELKTNDEIKIEGKVFSDILGDPWIDVTSLEIIKKAPEEKINGDN